MAWYYARGDQAVGPLDEDAFQQAVADGLVAPETLVWREGMAQWTPHAALAAPAPEPGGERHACAVCGAVFPGRDLLAFEDRHVCARCKPAFFERLQETGEVHGELALAGFANRAVAKILDYVVMMGLLYGGGILIGAALGNALFFFDPAPTGSTPLLVFGILWNILSFGFPLAYNTWFIGRFAATPGKLAVGIRVARPDGTRVTYARALGRHFAEMLTGLTCLIGYLLPLFDARQRALHDFICDTRVFLRDSAR